ncbi:MAG TPA: enoyl-CoA hydratase/isomerase family protein [Croceibacterium sp.]|nr:enoyl-CoA hydratase/isomerase family protein [Croceibacterium sp.]
MSDVLTRREGAVGHISLNRPQALHALTREMCEAISTALLEWRVDDGIELVMIDHAGGRGFCAGGDVALVRRSALEDGGAAGRAFFHAEYRMNHLLFTYPKPTAVFMDGITMGGGVGLALPCTYRVATENTVLAMPETAIGLFPDVGGGRYLSRLRWRYGQFLALTGARLDPAECLHLGLATRYVPSERLPELKATLGRDPRTADRHIAFAGASPGQPRIAGNRLDIMRLFKSDRFADILAALEADPGEWAAKELATLRRKSPQACQVALEVLRRGAATEDFAEEMRREYAVAARVILRPDFAEGVRAVLIDKDNAPRWDPATPEGVTADMLAAIFAPLPAQEEWTPFPA